MRLYVVYAPVHHTPGIVQKTSDDAEKDEESGRDKPPAWSVQPKSSEPDKKASARLIEIQQAWSCVF